MYFIWAYIMYYLENKSPGNALRILLRIQKVRIMPVNHYNAPSKETKNIQR